MGTSGFLHLAPERLVLYHLYENQPFGGCLNLLTANLQGGAQCSSFLGLLLSAKAAVLSGEITQKFIINGFEIEIGATLDLLSASAELGCGYIPDEGFISKAHASNGIFGVGTIIRIKQT